MSLYKNRRLYFGIIPTSGVARILAGKANELRLGNLEARRDWGHAADYVDGIWRMLQQDAPDDYVIATGVTHSVQDFVEMAFGLAGLDYRQYVVIDPQLHRPAEVDLLMGNSAKASALLGWTSSTTFASLVREMVAADCGALNVGPDSSNKSLAASCGFAERASGHGVSTQT
jgi:GDPmannose 4,6-dehydratase